MAAMQQFFFSIFNMIPAFLMEPPIIYFISIAIGIYVAALFVTFFHGGRRK